ncbi:MAG: BlaI/MecI/CopY family transcriptional regulator, partial [Clostridia bacterium]|nr:BlaI/MecI/CopY family transcriptional regulator [Clostridia bacterium]
MDKLHLAEGDYRFMTIIWDNEPLSSRALVELCLEKLGWKKSTTYTTLKKMCDKGFA